MNIFALSYNPVTAAEWHCDKHVIKMITETAQIISTVLRSMGESDEILYRPTHQHHPCVVWAGECSYNFGWTCDLLQALIREYDYRWPGQEKKFVRARKLAAAVGKFKAPPYGPLTRFALAMPEEYQHAMFPVRSYREYYIGEKASFARWTRRDPPKWWAENQEKV